MKYVIKAKTANEFYRVLSPEAGSWVDLSRATAFDSEKEAAEYSKGFPDVEVLPDPRRESKAPEIESTPQDRFNEALWQQFGGNWRKTINIQVDAAALSQVISLAQGGLEGREEYFRTCVKQGSMSRAEYAANYASLQIDLDRVVEEALRGVQSYQEPKKPKRPKR